MTRFDPSILALAKDVTEWRRDLHQHPEVLYDVHRTAAFVAEKLKAFGVDEVATGLGQTGVVGLIRGKRQTSGKTIALRADMDALPLSEETNLPYASRTPGKMHACGHDGHTAMLLGAARKLAEDRDFDGTVAVVFQPAEEGGAGAKAMIDDGLVSRFGIQKFYGMHNMPGMPIGTFAIRKGPIMAATVQFRVTIDGKGSHAAQPHNAVDPIVIASHIVTALQSIPSRNADPLKSLVISVTAIVAGGEAYNIIPSGASMRGTVRFLEPSIGKMAEERFRAIVDGTARMFGARVEIEYNYGYPVTMNHGDETEFATKIASTIAVDDRVDLDIPPMMGGEDFSFMLLEKPGAFIFIGNGDSAGLHNPTYDFNDQVIPYGMTYWTEIARKSLPL